MTAGKAEGWLGGGGNFKGSFQKRPGWGGRITAKALRGWGQGAEY